MPKATIPIQTDRVSEKEQEFLASGDFTLVAPNSDSFIEDIMDSPPDLGIIPEYMIKAKIKQLRAEISELAKERGILVEDGVFDFNDYLDEEFIDINVIETRATTSTRKAPPPVEGNTTD